MSARRISTLKPRAVVLFWLPLAATWLMMAVELPYITAIVARLSAAERNLAAFGVATSMAWLIESPIMMLLSAGTALIHDRASYLALRRFAMLLNSGVTVAMATLSLPAVFHFVGETLIGLPPPISDLARKSTTILILWPASIGIRRFYQGVLVRHHMTRRVAYGTVVRLSTMSATAAVLAFATSLPGATLGAIALLTGVICEAAASRLMARHLIATLMQSKEVAAGTLLSLRDIARFYYPLALTSVLSMALGPLVTFGLGRGRAPLESLAVWPVITALIFMFRSGGVAFQEVGVALTGREGENHLAVKRAAEMLALCASGALAVLALTPLETLWFERVAGLSHSLAAFARWPVRVLIVLPALEYLLSFQRAAWILAHRTAVITIATAIETGGLALTLLAAVGLFDMPGALAGAIAMITGRLAANTFLYARTR